MNSVITGKTRIMVVDDDKEIREVISVLLTNENFDVIEAGAGEDAMKLMTANIDLIILDVMMPGISGYQVSRMIRESSNVPILFLTARTQSSDLVLGYSSGGDDFVLVVLRVESVLRRHDQTVKIWEQFCQTSFPGKRKAPTITCRESFLHIDHAEPMLSSNCR